MSTTATTTPVGRKGKIIDTHHPLAQRYAQEMNTTVEEVREYENGAIGGYFKNGKFRFLGGAEESKLKDMRLKAIANKKKKEEETAITSSMNAGNPPQVIRSRKPISLKTAVRLLRQYYDEKHAAV